MKQLICPICNDRLRPSLGYGTGYWVCNCALRVGITTNKDKKDWVMEVEAIFNKPKKEVKTSPHIA